MSLGRGIFKSVLVIAPIAGLMIWYVWHKQDVTEALVERDTQRFEEHYNKFMGSLEINKDNKADFEKRASEAVKKAEQAQAEADLSKGSLARAGKEFDRVMAEEGKIYGEGGKPAPAGTTPPKAGLKLTPAK